MHEARALAEPFFRLTFEQIRECLAPLRDTLGCLNMYSWCTAVKSDPERVAIYARAGCDIFDVDPLDSSPPTAEQRAQFDSMLARMEFAGEGPVADMVGNVIYQKLWSREAKIENHLMYVACCYWALALYIGPDGGDWGWKNLLPWSEWPGPNRDAWEAACERARMMAQ